MWGAAADGPAMMIKSLLGIDPAQMREGFEAMQQQFARYAADMEMTRAAIQRIEQRLDVIDRKIDAILMDAKLIDIRETMANEDASLSVNGVSKLLSHGS